MPVSGLLNKVTEYGDAEFAAYMRRSFVKSMGFDDEALDRPVVGVISTFSEFNNCHRGMPELVAAVKRGVLAAGALPLECPVISLGEPFVFPTSMLYRNLLAMDVESMVRAQPMDAAVLVGGCDKTLPAMLMGGASADVPAVVLAVGPMLTGHVDGQRVGACTDCRRFWGQFRRGEVDAAFMGKVERNLATTAGTCAVMGTASTMACCVEAMGMMLPGGAAVPAVHSDRLRHGEATGRLAAQLARAGGPRPSQILTEAAFDNALRALLCLGGSTNAVIHLAAIAGRVGVRLDLAWLNAVSDATPLLVDLKPTGQHYMEDFHRAGGLGVALGEIRHLLCLDALTVTGRTLGEELSLNCPAFPQWQSVVRPASNPLQAGGAVVALFGSLAPDGAILKRSAASPQLLEFTGRAVVFDSAEDLARRVDDPALDVRPDDVLVLRNAGPVGAPGMPEAGYLPIPKKLAGVKDIIRISDARMSGTAFGTVVLHVSPEAAVGGPLALVQDGDWIELSASRRTLNLLVNDGEIARRRETFSRRPQTRPAPDRGYERLYRDAVQQAHLGADFDFLRHSSMRDGDRQGSTT